MTLVDFGKAPAAGVLETAADRSTLAGIGVVSPARSTAFAPGVLLTAPATDRGCDTARVESPLRGFAV